MTKNCAEKQNRRFSYFPPMPVDNPLDPMGNRALNMQPPPLLKNHARILIACLPKSGSTFLSTMVSLLPGMRRAPLYPNPVRRREQEIDLMRLLQVEMISAELRKNGIRKPKAPSVGKPGHDNHMIARGWVAQHHVRYSDITRTILDDYAITPIVLVRNIFDALVSLRDHLRQQAVYMSMAYFCDDMREMDDDQILDFLVDMVAPWYINFYVTWQDCPDRMQISYEYLRVEPLECLRKITAYAGLDYSDADLITALHNSRSKPIRFNKGVTGRGSVFSDRHRELIVRYTSYYPHVDFAPIGL